MTTATLCIVFSVLMLINGNIASMVCEEDADCGWNAKCVDNNECTCLQGYTLSSNNRDCIDSFCADPNCLDCTSDKEKCRHCIGFVEEDTGLCLSSCETDYKFMVDGSEIGRVCPVSTGSWSYIYVTIIVAVVAAVLLIMVVILACYWKHKSVTERKRRFELLNRQISREHSVQKDVSQVSESINRSGQVSHLSLIKNMATLRKSWDVLIQMYTEARTKVQCLNKDTRVWAKYKNIVSGLGQVIDLLRQNEPHPESAGLFEWAVILLNDYRRLKGLPDMDMDLGRQETHSVTPGSSLTRLTSAFQSDHFVGDGHFTHHVPGDVSPSTTTMSFTYERVPGQYSTFRRDREVGEVSFINLQHDYTDPVDV